MKGLPTRELWSWDLDPGRSDPRVQKLNPEGNTTSLPAERNISRPMGNNEKGFPTHRMGA